MSPNEPPTPANMSPLKWWHGLPTSLTLPLETILYGGMCGVVVLGVILASGRGKAATQDGEEPSGLSALWMLQAFRPLEDMPELIDTSADTEGVLTVLLSAPEETTVTAPVAGTVVTAGPVAGHGHWVTIKARDGLLYHIAFLDEGADIPSEGSSVRQGSRIGKVSRLGDDLGYGVLIAIENNDLLVSPDSWPRPPVELAGLLFTTAP